MYANMVEFWLEILYLFMVNISELIHQIHCVSCISLNFGQSKSLIAFN